MVRLRPWPALVLVHVRPYSAPKRALGSIGSWRGVQDNMAMIRRLWPFVWPHGGSPDAASAKVRISAAFGLLVAGKVLNVQVPYIFKQIVEQINGAMGAGMDAADLNVFTVAGAVLLGCMGLLFILWSPPC